MPKIEPLNSNYDEEKVVEAISVALSEFYTSLTNKLNKIKLKDILKKKNPYLYRAKGINDATMVINRILSAYICSSEETIFGNTFFEPISRSFFYPRRIRVSFCPRLPKKPDGDWVKKPWNKFLCRESS